MSDVIDARGSTAAATPAPHRTVSAHWFVLAGLVGVLLVGAVLANGHWWSQVVPGTLGFATAIMIIAAAVVGWERQVDAAATEGLVKHYDQHPSDS
ncbi:MAG: hypothetical protein ABWY45_04560 [Mycobacterium sp.]